MNKQDLINGEEFFFNNEAFQIWKQGDDIREAKVSFNGKEFTIWFNGKFIHISKTFKSMANRLEKLRAKWGLEAGEL